MMIKRIVFFSSLIILLIQLFLLLRLFSTLTPDFSIFYSATKDVMNGINVYKDTSLFTGFMYPTVTTLFYTPFQLFPYSLAQGIFTVLNILSFFFVIFISLKILNKRVDIFSFLLVSAFVFSSFPVKFTLGMGQINNISNVFVLLSFYFYLKEKDVFAGVFYSCAILLKPILLFFIIFFLLKKKYKLLGVTSAIVIVLTVISFIQNSAISFYYITSFLPHLLTMQGREVYYNQGVTGFVSRLLPNMFFREILTWILDLLLLGVGMLAFKINRENKFQFSILLIILVLIDSLSWQHHFVFLIFPFIYLSSVLIKKDKKLLLYLFLAYVLIGQNIKNPEQFSQMVLHNIVLSHVFLGTILLLTLFIKQVNEQ